MLKQAIHPPHTTVLICFTLTIGFLVIIIFILVNIYLIRIGLFGKLSQLTTRSITPVWRDKENGDALKIMAFIKSVN